jgi:hypothetical protein
MVEDSQMKKRLILILITLKGDMTKDHLQRFLKRQEARKTKEALEKIKLDAQNKRMKEALKGTK